MTFANFKTYVAAYINRDASSFVRGSVNLLEEAINDAIRDAQMQKDFNQLRTIGYISTNAYGSDISNVKTTSALSTALPIKKINSVWQYDNSTGSDQKIRQINFILATDIANILPTLLDVQTEPVTRPVTFKNRAYQYGTKLYVTGYETATTFWLDVVKQLADLSGSSDTNIFTEKYKKWTLFATLQQLNAYLPETEQIVISTKLLDRQWEIVCKDDDSYQGDNDDANSLD